MMVTWEDAVEMEGWTTQREVGADSDDHKEEGRQRQRGRRRHANGQQ